MDSNPTGLTRRQLLGGVATLGTVTASGLAVGGTVGAFADADSSTGNTFQSGSLDLTFGSPSSLDFTKDLPPGSSVSSAVELRNGTSLPGSVDVDVSHVDSGGGASADAVARELEVTSLTYGGTSVLGQFADANGNGIVDLADVAASDQTAGESAPNDLVDLADPGTGRTFGVELTLQTGTNDLAGNSIDVQFTFHLNQTDGQ